MDALAPLYNIHEDETAINPNADITIHPVMQRNKWNYPMPKHLAEFPLGGDFDGYWNPVSERLPMASAIGGTDDDGSVQTTLRGKPYFHPFE